MLSRAKNHQRYGTAVCLWERTYRERLKTYLFDRVYNNEHHPALLARDVLWSLRRLFRHLVAKDLHWVADNDSRRRLRSATTHQLVVPRTRLRTVGDRAFGIAGARVWNDLPSSVVSAPSLAVFKKNLKTHLFRQSYSHCRQVVNAF